MDAAIPWRRTALVATGVAVLELLVLVAIGVVAIGRPLARHARERPVVVAEAPARVPQQHVQAVPVVPRLTRARTSVLVLNGNGRQGAASLEAQALETLGYRIGATGNARRTSYARSLVMYRPGYRPEALRLARDAGIRVVGPLDGLRASDLGRSQLAVIVGG
jgi:hypothetical protein